MLELDAGLCSSETVQNKKKCLLKISESQVAVSSGQRPRHGWMLWAVCLLSASVWQGMPEKVRIYADSGSGEWLIDW